MVDVHGGYHLPLLYTLAPAFQPGTPFMMIASIATTLFQLAMNLLLWEGGVSERRTCGGCAGRDWRA